MTALSSSSCRILVIGGTGMIGQHLVKASLAAGHPTAVLVRPASVAAKATLVEAFKARGANIVYGDIDDEQGLLAAVKEADVVISAVGHTSPEEVLSQLKIVAAIHKAGNIKRFVPSEYGCDVEVAAEQMLEPARSILGAKVRVREALQAAGVPHTIVCSYWSQGFLLPRAGNPEADGPPRTTATIFGDGQVQGFFVHETDMSRVAIKAVQDPRTLNKILHVRPPSNLCSLNHLVSLWENKTGKILQKQYVAEQELRNKVRESPFPLNLQLAIVHATLVVGQAGHTKHQKKKKLADVEATQLYPDMSYITVQDCLDALHI
ncbi:unnamed protein product [Urochloa decumbens]|uniref:NmrA-like domain-containing protein n=1 Tax=Urochloa decumbens TaxID=240449 RepID=A0ABC9GRT0_9POAL